MEMIFHSQANKTHFHKKSCALGLILKVRVSKNSEMAYSFLSRLQDKANVPSWLFQPVPDSEIG